MKRWSLRLKLCVWAVLLGAATLLAIGTILAWRVRVVAEQPIEADLQAELGEIMPAIAKENTVDWANRAKVGGILWMLRSHRRVQVEKATGEFLYHGDAGPIPVQPGLESYDVTVDGRKMHVVQGMDDKTKSFRVRLAADSGPVEQILSTLWATCFMALPVVLLSMWLGAWWLSKRVMRPVEELAEAASEIDARTSDRQLPVTGTSDEIGHLTDVLNDMFGRIRESFAQARRFSADASHELKTPLTIIRGEVEAALRADNLTPQTEKTMLDLLEETGRLINIVEGLLLLSQADAGKLQFDLRPVSLTTLLSEIVEDIEILASPREIEVETDFQQNVLVEGSAQFLRQVALNLFDNAIKYNVDRGHIRAVLSIHNGLAVFYIMNTGPSIAEEDRVRIFDRFHRGDRSRDRTTGGQGLGLSICREIIRSHGGDITLEPAAPGWTKFQLTLPSSDLTNSGVRRAEDNSAVPPLASEPPAVVSREIR